MEEMNYFYKSNQIQKGQIKPKKKTCVTTKVKSSFKREVYKEKAMKINVKKFGEEKSE